MIDASLPFVDSKFTPADIAWFTQHPKFVGFMHKRAVLTDDGDVYTALSMKIEGDMLQGLDKFLSNDKILKFAPYTVCRYEKLGGSIICFAVKEKNQ